MDLTELQRKLIAAARLHPPSDRVPPTFEKRVMAHLRERAPADYWALWARALWRAAAPCVGIMLLLGAWSWFAPGGSVAGNDLSQEFENTVLAAAEQVQPSDLAK